MLHGNESRARIGPGLVRLGIRSLSDDGDSPPISGPVVILPCLSLAVYTQKRDNSTFSVRRKLSSLIGAQWGHKSCPAIT